MVSLNINGERDRVKRANVSEIIKQKNLKVTCLQEKHTDISNEVQWAMWQRAGGV